MFVTRVYESGQDVAFATTSDTLRNTCTFTFWRVRILERSSNSGWVTLNNTGFLRP